MNFQFHALDSQKFAHLFALDDDVLAQQNGRRVIVREELSAPCRVSLEDARIGETVILVNYMHMSKASPYRATHAVYVREGVATAKPEQNEIPAFLQNRLLSVRAFDKDGMMVDAEVIKSTSLDETIERFFVNTAIADLHIHFAKAGCFAARVTRA